MNKKSSNSRRLHRDLSPYPDFMQSLNNTHAELTNLKLSMISFHSQYTSAYKKDRLGVVDKYVRYVEEIFGKEILDKSLEISNAKKINKNG